MTILLGLLLALFGWLVPVQNASSSGALNDLSRVQAELANYAANNNGNYPLATVEGWSAFAQAYLVEVEFLEISAYQVDFEVNDNKEIMHYLVGYTCGDNGAQVGSSRRQITLVYNDLCLDNK